MTRDVFWKEAVDKTNIGRQGKAQIPKQWKGNRYGNFISSGLLSEHMWSIQASPGWRRAKLSEDGEANTWGESEG